MSVLALDLSTVTGWALHDTGMEEPLYGTLTLPRTPEEVGPPCEALRTFLRDQHKLWNFTDVVFEAQHVSARMDMKTVYKLIALGGMVEWWAFKMGIRCYQVPIATWRKHFLGKGGGMKREEAKTRCMAVMQQLGWDTDEIDAAEACGILDYFLSLNPNYDRPWRDRMLAGGLII